MVDQVSLAAPIIVGLIGVLIAVLDRGYKRFKEEQAVNPQLKFGGTYLLNFLLASGLGSVIVITVVPAIVAGVGGITAEGFAGVVILQFVFGYTTAYTTLSKLNTETERKIELLQAKDMLTTNQKGKLDSSADKTKIVGQETVEKTAGK